LPTSQSVETNTFAPRRILEGLRESVGALQDIAGHNCRRVAVSRGRLEGAPLSVTERPAWFMPETTPAMPAHDNEMNGIPRPVRTSPTTRSRLRLRRLPIKIAAGEQMAVLRRAAPGAEGGAAGPETSGLSIIM